MLAFTWNLRGKIKSLELACHYLATKGTCVVCLQEMPQDASEAQIEQWSSGALVVLTPLVDQRVVMLTSRDIRRKGKAVIFVPGWVRNAAERMVGVQVKAPSLGALQVVGVHFPDLRNEPKGWPRERIVATLAEQLRMFWTQGPLILLGDFNAHPFDREIAMRTALWATRDKFELGDERDPIPGQPNLGMPIFHHGKTYKDRAALAKTKSFQTLRPLYNPMWRWLSEQAQHPHGTFYRKHDDAVVSWQCLDQIMVSPDLADRIARVTILERLLGEVLIEPNRAAMNGDYGDHLPVELELAD
jgi:exonuclease III